MNRRRLLRLRAKLRLRARRARWMLVLCGIGMSALALGAGVDASGTYILLNPPGLLAYAALAELEIDWSTAFSDAMLFTTSVGWWLWLGVRFRRKRARPWNTAVV